MTSIKRPVVASLSAISIVLSLPACATAYQDEPTPAPASAQEVAFEPVVGNGPALWKVADEDTTIYLFGTVHALPDDVDWMSGAISEALTSSDTLVTEIETGATDDPALQQMMMSKAVNASGGTLREILTEEQRTQYEAAMTSMGMPVAAFDAFEPWFAGMTLAVLPLMKAGYTPESGVETVIDKAAGPEITREALETAEFQIGLFDTLPQDSQIEFLISTASAVDQLPNMMDAMVKEWLEGDADGLAELMNESLTDPALADALLYGRNANWAEWVDSRLDKPGTVFMAVGAGHLAGDKSVQDYLDERGIETRRIQ